LSFFSISRLVISSVSADTSSWRCWRLVQQVHLRQLAVRMIGEQRLLALLHHPGAGLTGLLQHGSMICTG
jgi:hypothetical protein